MNHQNLLSVTRELLKPSTRQGIVLLSARELDKMRQVGKLAANLLKHLEPMVQPGVSTKVLNDEAERWMQAHGAISATLGYAPPGYPPFSGSICTSVNDKNYRRHLSGWANSSHRATA